MVLFSRLVHKLLISILLVANCLLVGCDYPALPELKTQIIIIYDKSRSVTYSDTAKIRAVLQKNFDGLYQDKTNSIQLSTLEITSATSVIPTSILFTDECPTPNPRSRSERNDFQDWELKKKAWISDQIDTILNKIQKPPNSNITDVFSIFTGLEEIQKNNGPWDSIRVLVFSDMVNTTPELNMIKKSNVISDLGGKQCREYLEANRIEKCSGKVFINIFTPDKISNTQGILSFWKGFFREWGLKEHQYQFESF